MSREKLAQRACWQHSLATARDCGGGTVPLQGCHAVPVQLQGRPENERGHLPVCNSLSSQEQREELGAAHLGRQGEHLLMSYDGKS